ncbi:MAG: rRNA maturation RNase YbeY [Chloroflexota bacterium]
MMEINVLVDASLKKSISKKWLEKLTGRVLLAAGVEANAELSLMVTNQEKVHELNLKYLGRDAPTDVLSFPMLPVQPPLSTSPFVSPPDGVKHLGEVVISYPQAALQAEEHGHPVKREIAILIIHGVLHLLGYDHVGSAPGRKMRTREAQILASIEKELT